MEQLLAHLVGDYIFQIDWMAKNKTKKWWIALVHALTYTLPFLFLTTSASALLVICLSHAVIDYFRLARFLVFAKNKITDFNLQWKEANVTGYHNDTPPWLAFWLLIIADNTLHLICNYFAIRWL